MITIKLFAGLRDLTKLKKIELNITNSTISEVITQLIKEYPQLKHPLTNENGKIDSIYYILVNGQNINLKEGINTIIEEGDVISILPPIGGGK